MESGRKRVEQKGRFTITEIIPGSPYSTRLSSPTFQDDAVSVSDFPASIDAPVSTGSCSEVASIQPQSTSLQQLKLAESNGVEKIAINGAVEPALTMELLSETHTQPPETVLVPPVPIEANVAAGLAAEPEASTGDSVGEVSTATTASATAAPGSPSRKYSSPKKTVQRARRVKRRGRFTIIELASDSPTSRKNADDHDLKQIINVLQEQQHQLMTIPTQINELKRQRANLNIGETRDEEMRELHKKVDKLTQANESLHSLINAAEREARHRTLEIECLSEENDELRHRCGQLETRYMDERKQSFVLEEEVQRLRMLSLTLQEQQLRQQQQSQATHAAV
ncbi:hypothetical protein AM588_10001940 [Phytophthora nicotianae]|uniref:Uncharacterized protein n=1 Tax=Phytophthora nicotianae TaxID=4792 RepID=A0A0W8CXS2_PHYNI|nr:hypothetical protein AM588_10001940 [Phytophthora nicotianae]